MTLAPITYLPVGLIRSSHVRPDQTPIQPVFSEGCAGRIELQPEYAAGLRDLDGFSHIYLLYHLNRAPAVCLTVKPFLQETEHGIFATRAPARPNPIGLSIVRLLRIEGCILEVDGIDVLDGTPLLDIKPYTARFDRLDDTRNGWQDGLDEVDVQARGRRQAALATAAPKNQLLSVIGDQ